MGMDSDGTYYVDVILPRPLNKPFTYAVTAGEAAFLKRGMRVSVPFRGNKIYTGIVDRVHRNRPTAYEAKDIHLILDERPVVTPNQFRLWKWIAGYYMCTIGEVVRAALPSAYLLQSDTVLEATVRSTEMPADLSPGEVSVLNHLKNSAHLTIDEIKNITGKKNITRTIQSLYDKNLVKIKEVLYEKYIPKEVTYIRISPEWDDEAKIAEFLDSRTAKAPGQREVILTYFGWKSAHPGREMPVSLLVKSSSGKRSSVNSLIKKGFFRTFSLREDRVNLRGGNAPLPELSDTQNQTLNEIQHVFRDKGVCLLHGITGSGKTEIYIHLIHDLLERGEQVLYLVPEISLTTQLIGRLQKYFGARMLVYHSRYSIHERYEVWENMLNYDGKEGQLIIGARSAVLLPFKNPGLIIVDEEHERSYKQFDPAPRYHARDTSVMYGKISGCKVLLGTATPSMESYRNAVTGKYGLVRIDKRYADIPLPEIEMVNLRETARKKLMKGHFTPVLIEHIENTLARHRQVILFQNRRGYAPVSICPSCGHSPQCPNCDVSLTNHKFRHELICHYCGYHRPEDTVCPACGNPGMLLLGVGTQMIEKEVKELFPGAKTARLDYDTTRGKYAFQRLINDFQNREIDILIGTQMVSKGLDFSHVSLVGVIQADVLLNNPDFRAHEKAYQMLVQVAGRAGRALERGKVVIQTFNPAHPLFQYITEGDFEAFYSYEIKQRELYHYPPFVKNIKIIMKHKNPALLYNASQWLAGVLRQKLDRLVLGPADPPVARINNLYIKEILVKLPSNSQLHQYKSFLYKSIEYFFNIREYFRVRIIINVD